MNLIKILLISLGTISLALGILGIMIPGLPTTPFLLLTAGLYIRSSEKLYHRLIHNRFIGSYILEFQSNGGMTKKSKLAAIIIMWTMIILSCLLFINTGSVRLIIVVVGIIGTVVMGYWVPTAGNKTNE